MDAQRKTQKVVQIGSHFLSPEERSVLQAIRSRGGCVVVLSPEEIVGQSSKALERAMVHEAMQRIENSNGGL